ncbi:phosphate acetyltransferase [Roseobacter sp. SK209-2-6]|uniref:phosphate acetyltransferase n=1 Tax=Roseobacter sp. SK209-2-6 TaxID=388739 RepID=UPI0000F3C4F6|nr:phosphate acetyltransferase [Roseobacter sp. SK209-2-6]EBA18123.1 phosphate acetyltransferase [Roseobacter sp. SK209-2-6]
MTQALSPSALLGQTPASSRAVIALSEGSDPRIVAGAIKARSLGLADIVLVGATAEVEAELSAQGTSSGPGLTIQDPAKSPFTSDFSKSFHALRKHKGMTPEKAAEMVQDPLVFAAMLVREGHATGTVGGAVATTSDVVRTALQVIGKAPDAAMVSSFFLMYPPKNATAHSRAMLYSDCGLVIDPSAEDLVAIASASALSCQNLLRQEPKIAMLSFSTKGSARHPAVTKVSEATAALHQTRPELQVDGELQFDAAFAPEVGEKKSPGSSVAGQANVMIFPNLDAGNIGYKISQRLGGYSAIGPILQGLAQPANDLSRGCSAEDVVEMIAVTVLQAQNAGS